MANHLHCALLANFVTQFVIGQQPSLLSELIFVLMLVCYGKAVSNSS